MDYQTSDGACFHLPCLTHKKLERITPRKFVAKLLKLNKNLNWGSFNQDNIVDIISWLTKGYTTSEGVFILPETTRLSHPFEYNGRGVGYHF